MSNSGIKNFTTALAWGALCFATLAPAGAQAQPAVAQAPGCESKTNGGDLIVYSCPIVATEAAQRFRFVANFGGSHDDTKLSLQATLDGAPAVCAPGSKASSRYEDGDIRLDCRLELKAAAGTRHVWAVKVQWYHAQLFDVQFTPE
jgi:hypothetical protein